MKTAKDVIVFLLDAETVEQLEQVVAANADREHSCVAARLCALMLRGRMSGGVPDPRRAAPVRVQIMSCPWCGKDFPPSITALVEAKLPPVELDAPKHNWPGARTNVRDDKDFPPSIIALDRIADSLEQLVQLERQEDRIPR